MSFILIFRPTERLLKSQSSHSDEQLTMQHGKASSNSRIVSLSIPIQSGSKKRSTSEPILSNGQIS